MSNRFYRFYAWWSGISLFGEQSSVFDFFWQLANVEKFFIGKRRPKLYSLDSILILVTDWFNDFKFKRQEFNNPFKFQDTKLIWGNHSKILN